VISRDGFIWKVNLDGLMKEIETIMKKGSQRINEGTCDMPMNNAQKDKYPYHVLKGMA